MKQANEEILDQKEVNQFTYKNIMQVPLPREKYFKHTDQSVNKAFVFQSGGYVSLSVVPHEPKKVSGSDRKLMFQQRTKPIIPAQQWTNKFKTKEAGWKFHISIAQEVVNMEKAWNILVPILLKYKVGHAKIVHQKNKQEASKVICVYTFSGGPPLDQWKFFIRDAELAFKQNGILPGEKIFEYPVKGSSYFYYRNDADQKGDYVKDEYSFMYRLVDQIPISNAQELEFERQIKDDKSNVGCIVRLKGTDICCLYVKLDNGWERQEFNIDLLKDLENPEQMQQITIAPIINRPAYLELIVPRLDQSITSTNNVTKESPPFRDVDVDEELAHLLSQQDTEQSNKGIKN